MLKNAYKLGIAGLVGIGLAVAQPAQVQADYSEAETGMTPMNRIVLEPGWRSSCDSSFVVENLGNRPAQIKVRMGVDGELKDTIQKWSKRGYDLIYNLSFAKQLGKTVNIDDVALIENLSKNSRVSVHC